ncbi:toll/interleukin-1 receptor domain-containing protein [Virgisporangium aurantiacum]|uniref:TIR domain-containing protein n=1 Tax=Virgisporangium aurantiacum TaxID=175570 RepID=A0A8J3Z9R0_9ACTN|nr:toll/interleukin-1 receptor domain-containing protein [Virgisporangium aurantiacum]GIJ57756.1 hypothetical protein Vau01_052720 [Virgisporangium aurantiacum]
MGDTPVGDDSRHQAELFQQWLQFAPEPRPRDGNTYDAFISYRSSDRTWAMALYDALKLAGWNAFLDQYDLVPGANLEASLANALEASSSGVIVWSSHTKDSKWCQSERNAMRNLGNRAGGFNYVFSKLDHEPLPLFAEQDLYVDFKENPEGPSGVNLLRLMCGMRGITLAPEAVVLAQRVDEDAKQAMVQIRGAIEAGNAGTLLTMGTSDRPAMLASPGPILAAAHGLIRLGSYEKARQVLARAGTFFPGSFRARQLEGLVLRRLGRYQDAIDVMSELKAAGHNDPETLGILAAAWDGRYRETGKTLHLRKSRDLYLTAFQGDPMDYYTGINAASKSLFLGETDLADSLANEVFPLVSNGGDSANMWPACTLGEVYLLQRKIDLAAAQYQKVVDRHPTAVGDLMGTGEQARRICTTLELSPEETARVMAPFALLTE